MLNSGLYSLGIYHFNGRTESKQFLVLICHAKTTHRILPGLTHFHLECGCILKLYTFPKLDKVTYTCAMYQRVDCIQLHANYMLYFCFLFATKIHKYFQ